VESVILVDETGFARGTAAKAAVHHARTPLHLAFSCYLFDGAGRFLLTRRAESKRTWPGVWTNTCCGHPLPGEPVADSVRRRLRQELGIATADLVLVLPRFRYQAQMANGVVENEVCPVYAAYSDATPTPDPAEVAEIAWVDWGQFCDGVRTGQQSVSPWCAMQVAELVALGPRPLTWLAADDADLPPAALLAGLSAASGVHGRGIPGLERLCGLRDQPASQQFQHVVEYVLWDTAAGRPLGPAHADEIADSRVGVRDDLGVIPCVDVTVHLGGPYSARVAPGQVLVVLAEQPGVDELRLAHDAVDPGPLGQHVEVHPERRAFPAPLAGAGVLQGVLHGPSQVGVDGPDHGREDLRLGSVIGVEAAGGHPGPGADVRDRGPVVAALAEQLLRRGQQALGWPGGATPRNPPITGGLPAPPFPPGPRAGGLCAPPR
jgi:isopentenyl-diphosphate Delta-isomerase